jgi:hypothetical protein
MYLQQYQAKILGEKATFCWHLESFWRKEPDPDPYQNVNGSGTLAKGLLSCMRSRVSFI